MGVNFSRPFDDRSQREPLLPFHSEANSTIATRDSRSGTNLTAASEKELPKDTPREKNTVGNRPSHRDLIGYLTSVEKNARAQATIPEPARLLVEKWKGQCDVSFISKKLNDGKISFDPKSLAIYEQKIADFFDAVASNKDFQDLVMKFSKETDRPLPLQKGDTARFMNNKFDSQGKVVFTLHPGDHGDSRSLAQTTDVGKEKTQFVLGCSSGYGGGGVNFSWGLEIASKADFEKKETVS